MRITKWNVFALALLACTIAFGATLLNTTVTGTLGVTGDITAGEDVAVTGALTAATVNASDTANWDTAYTDRLKWDGGATGLVAATARTSLALVPGTNVQAYDAGLLDIAGLTVTDGNVIIGDGSNWVAETGATLQTSLGLAIGTDVQAHDDGLDDISALAVTDGNIIVGDGTNWVVESGATAQVSLGLEIGVDVQAYDAGLADLAGLAVTDGNFAVGDGTNWVAESGATARTSLGLGTIATQSAAAVALTGGTLDGAFVLQIDPAATADNTAGAAQFIKAPNGGTDGGSGSYGRAGGSYTVQGGDGSDAVTSGAPGGNGGNVLLIPGAPGNGEGAGDPGSAGSIILGNTANTSCIIGITAPTGDGASGLLGALISSTGNSSTSTNGGAAGNFVILGGDGGSSSNAGSNGGAGASIYLTPGAGGTEGSGGAAGADGDVVIGQNPITSADIGRLFLFNLPTADPHVANQVWANSNVLTLSAG